STARVRWLFHFRFWSGDIFESAAKAEPQAAGVEYGRIVALPGIRSQTRRLRPPFFLEVAVKLSGDLRPAYRARVVRDADMRRDPYDDPVVIGGEACWDTANEVPEAVALLRHDRCHRSI